MIDDKASLADGISEVVDSEGGTLPLPADANGEPAGLTAKEKKKRRSRQRIKDREKYIENSRKQ